MPSNKFQVFVSANGDDVGFQTNQMTLANDTEGMRRLSGALKSGAEIFSSWALAKGGETISVSGDSFLVMVPAECLADIPAMMEQYESLVNATLSVGVGRTLEEANKALASSKKAGKNRVTVYNSDQEEAVAKSQGDLDAPEEGDTSFDFGANAEPDELIEEGKKVISRMRHPKKKMAEDFLRYAIGETQDRPQISPDLERHLARFGIVDPKGYTFDAYGRDLARPIGGRKVFNQEPASLKHNRMMNRDYYAPYQSYGGVKKSESYDKDLREDWGNLIAEKHKESEQEERQEAPDQNDDVKKRVVSVLTQFKQMAPQLEEMQQSDPQLYASVTGMVQGMVEMARALFGNAQPVQKAEGSSFEQMRARREAKKARAKELADTTMGSAWSSKLGGFLVVGLDPHNRNRWRVTNIAENGMEGLGHTVHPTHEEALLEAHSMGADIHGAPLQTMAKDEDWDWSTGQLQKMEDLEEDLGKMAKLGPTFPGLGLPDNRRPTDIVTSRRQVEIKRRAIARSTRALKPPAAGKPYAWSPGEEPSQEYVDRVVEPHYKQVMAETRGGAGFESRGHSYALGGKVKPKKSSWSESQVQRHEDFHAMLSRVPEEGRKPLVANLFRYASSQLPLEQKNMVHNIGQFFYSPDDEEELASVISYLNDKNVRKMHQSNNKMTDERAIEYHKAARDFYRHMQHAAKHLDESWLTDKPNPLQVNKAEEKFEGGLADNKEDSEFDPEQLAAGIKVEMEHTDDPDTAKEIAKDHLSEDPAYYVKLAQMESADLDKAALEAGKTGRHHVVLPVGSTKDPGAGGTHEVGKIKTMDPQTGKTKWKSVRAGVVMAEDGTPQSSRLV